MITYIPTLQEIDGSIEIRKSEVERLQARIQLITDEISALEGLRKDVECGELVPGRYTDDRWRM